MTDLTSISCSPEAAAALVAEIQPPRDWRVFYESGALYVPTAEAVAFQAALRRLDDRALKLAERERVARLECGLRITAALPATTQANLAAHMAVIGLKAASVRTAEEQADADAYAAGVAWIAAMRARWREVAAGGLDPRDGAQWPVMPAEAVALAARF